MKKNLRKYGQMKRRKKTYRIRSVSTVLILITSWNLLISCQSVKQTTDEKVKFPELDIESQQVTENGNVICKNRFGDVVFMYEKSTDMVSIPYDYYMKIISFGIETGGIEK